MAQKSTFTCPACGEDVPAKARACPHCGACEKSGWNEEAYIYSGIDLPDGDFDYEKFKEEEFEEPRPKRGRELLWKITAMILLILTMLLIVGNKLFR